MSFKFYGSERASVAGNKGISDASQAGRGQMAAGRQYYHSQLKALRIQELSPYLARTVITGLVIVKNCPRSVWSKQGQNRFVMNFTIRDSPKDTINATCWGSEEFITGLSNGFTIGNVVDVRNAEIRLITASSDNAQYKPRVSSEFTLTVNESVSSVSLSASSNAANLDSLVSIPLNYPCSLTTLAQVQKFDPNDNLQQRRVNLLVSIRKVGIPRELVASKTGVSFLKCDVTVFDQSLSHFVIQLWDAEWIQYAKKWTPKDCVVLAHDVRLSYDEFRSTIVGSSDGKTVFIANPEIREALVLYTFMQSVGASEDPFDDCVDLETIEDVYTVEGLKRRISEAKEKSFRGILYAYFTKLDLDGHSFLTSTRCSSCKRILDTTEVPCQCHNLECPAGAGQKITSPVEEFDIPVSLTDHTGTLDRLRLKGGVAEALLSSTVDQFQKLTAAQRTMLKWEFLLERSKCYFQAGGQSDFQRNAGVKLLSIAQAQLPEICAKLQCALE